MPRVLRVAIVDDQSFVSESVRMGLFERYFPQVLVTEFERGQDYLEEVRKGTIFDLTLMDGKLAEGKTGPCYTSQAIKLCPGIKVIGFTADRKLADAFKDAGAVLFLNKQTKMEDMAEAIKGFLSQ